MAVPNKHALALKVASTYRFDGTRDNAREFCRRLATELRKTDTNFGLNWKRGNVGDQSADIIAYKDGEQTRIIDVIAAYDDPREWPTPDGPAITWQVHSIEKAGTVKWFWDEGAPLPPPPVVPPAPPRLSYARWLDASTTIATALQTHRGGYAPTDLAHFLYGLVEERRTLPDIVAEITGVMRHWTPRSLEKSVRACSRTPATNPTDRLAEVLREIEHVIARLAEIAERYK